MEPSKDSISVRLARLNTQILGRVALSGGSGNVLKRSLNREGLLDALTVLYDECNNETLKKSDQLISRFVERYRSVLSELRQLRVNISDFEVKNIIGRGNFGDVHVIREKHTGDVYAMKILRKEATLRQKNVTFYEEERDIMALSKSEWLIRLQYAFQDATQLYLVMEFCPGGDLAGLLDRRGGPLSEKDAIFYLAELTLSLGVLHGMGFVHRDIKPDNILLDRCGHLKLADFGSAAKISSVGKVTSPMPVGTPDYIAPEVLKALEDTKFAVQGMPCDYWAFGVVAYELVTYHTPFVSAAGSDKTTHVYNAIMQHGRTARTMSLKYPVELQSDISDDFRDLVRSLLHPLPDKRLGYEEVLRHKAFSNMRWNSLRKQVPPFVPVVNAVDDTSNFVEFEKQKPTPSVENFRTKTQFSGRSLPFIGFTYAQDANSLSMNTPDCSGDCTDVNKTDVTDSTDPSLINNGFLNASFNGTAICISNSRELDNLLESRKKEIETLHKKLAVAESKQAMVDDKQKRLTDLENQRSQLERDLSEMACQNQKLQHQLSMEHEERKTLESKSLQLIRNTKKNWQTKSEEKIGCLSRTIEEYQLKHAELETSAGKLQSQLEDALTDLRKANSEVDSLKQLQKNHKDSMAKARKLSRQSIVGVEQMSQENNVQLLQMTQNLNKELEAKSKLEAELKKASNRIKVVEDSEKNLTVELEECKKDFTDLQFKCYEITDLRKTIADLEEQNKFLMETGTQRLTEGRDKSTNLEVALKREKSNVTKLTNELEDLQFNVCHLESDCIEKDGIIKEMNKEKLELKKRLDNAAACEEKHMNKVASLEDLLVKLQLEVSVLEKSKKDESNLKPKPLSLDKSHDSKTDARASVLQEQISKLEEQLRVTREEATVIKQEARSANTALWKKEKELSDCDLDRRIASRELKQAEEKLKSYEEEKKKNSERQDAALKELRETVKARDKEIDKLNLDTNNLKRNIDIFEKKMKECQARVEEDGNMQQKTTAELDRSRNDVHRLKAELKYSENRRLKAEGQVDTARSEAKESEAGRCEEREERVRLEVTLHERNKECEHMQMNYKMLQEACTLLEDQLVDFERAMEAQEESNKKLRNETMALRNEIESLKSVSANTQRLLDNQRTNTAAAEAKHKEAVKQLEDEQSRNTDLEKQIDDLLTRESVITQESGSRGEEAARLAHELQQARVELRSGRAEVTALKEECTALLTTGAHLREDAMRVQLALRECEENNNTLRGLLEERETELLAQQAHAQQRELKAEATIAQQIKLIDFLQLKVEEASKKKKTLGDMLFGGKSSKENMPPATPQTPLASAGSNADQLKALVKERQKNRELREQVSSLQHKLSSIQLKAETSETDGTDKNSAITGITDTPRKLSAPVDHRERMNSNTSAKIVMEGYVRIQKGALMDRVYMKLVGNCLEWRGEGTTGRGELLLSGNPRLTSNLSSKDCSLALSEAENNNGFKIEVSSTTTSWPSQSLLVVCPSANQKRDWLSEIQKLKGVETVRPDEQRLALSAKYCPPSVLKGDKSLLMELHCFVEVSKGLFLIGSNGGLFSYSPGRSPVMVSGTCGVRHARLAAACDMMVLLDTAGRVLYGSLRQLTASLRAAVSAAPQLNYNEVAITGECQVFEISPCKQSTDRVALCASTASKLYIFNYDSLNMRFILARCLDTETISCMRFTPHTVIVASRKFYEIDLNNYRVEEFLDPSDTTLSHAVYAHKKNISPVSIVQIQDPKRDKNTEYLLCYSQFGVFVDEYGQRSRSEDITWMHIPLRFAYRKPFLFIVHFANIEVVNLNDGAYHKNGSKESDDASISGISTSSSMAMPEKIVIDMNAPRFLGKSMTQGSVYVSSFGSGSSQMVQVMELNGNHAFKNHLDLSIDTLDTIDDMDSCKDVKNINEIEDSDNISVTTEESIEIRSEFASSIREKAKLFNSIIQENKKAHVIQELLSGHKGKKTSQDESTSDSSEIESSSSYEDNLRRNTVPTRLAPPSETSSTSRHRPQSSYCGSPKAKSSTSSSERRKQVRFNQN